MNRLEFTVHGEPRGQPRHRARAIRKGGRWIGQVYLPDRAGKDDDALARILAWKAQVLSVARRHAPPEPWDGPVRCTIDAYFSRPQRLLRSTSPAGVIPHVGTPDVDNIAKLILDALTRAGVWSDDARVCGGEVNKWYVARGCLPGVHIVALHLVDVAPALFQESA